MSSEKSEAGAGALPLVSEGVGGYFWSELVAEVTGSWLNLFLLAVTAYLLYKIVRGWLEPEPVFTPPPPRPPPMKRRDMLLSQLRKFDGKDDGPVLLAVNGNIFNVSRGRRFYGPGKQHIHT
jgi:membrane-associated progesterone receptor component